jgi:hypothetical protein
MNGDDVVYPERQVAELARKRNHSRNQL